MSRRTAKVLVAVTAVVTLAGCAGLRPGVAAEVGDEKITLERVDSFAEVLCDTGLLASRAGTAAQTRTAALGLMVRAELAHRYADRYSSSVAQGDVDRTVASVEQAVADLSDDEREEFLAEVRDSVEGDALAQYAAAALVAAEGGQATQDAVFAKVTELYSQWADEAGVELDPRFGEWKDIDVEAGSGSLSVPATDEAPDPSAPGSRTCG